MLAHERSSDETSVAPHYGLDDFGVCLPHASLLVMIDSALHVDNRNASIGQLVVAERVFFGAQVSTPHEHEALREHIERRFDEAVQRGELGFDARVEIDSALKLLLGPRGEWIEVAGCRLASIAVTNDARNDLRLPLELLRPPTGEGALVVRCALAETETVPRGPCAYPEEGRIVLATADAGGPVPDAALLESMVEVAGRGMHLSCGSEHDRKRGAFDPTVDHLPRVSRGTLWHALRPDHDRPGAAVLQLVCHVRDGGLCLHADDAGDEVLVGAEALAAVLGPFASCLRLVVLVPVADRSGGDPGDTIIEVAMALHRKGMAAVVAPRVPLPVAGLVGTTKTLFGSLLGDARIPPTSLEVALARTSGYLSTNDGLAHLGLRLYARAADGVDTRPLVVRPYRGLSSFGLEHARFFFGREEETKHVVQRLVELDARGQPRLVLLVGAAGVGKSSLALAGVGSAMSKEGWTVLATQPAQRSLKLDALGQGRPGERRLIVVDQLEEILSAPHGGAAKYLRRLRALAAEKGTAVVVTVRVDALQGWERRVDDKVGRMLEQLVGGHNAFAVEPLDAGALRRVIVEPARSVGVQLDAGIVDRLCAEGLAEPGALSMLQLVLDQLWEQREGSKVVTSAYERGVAASLGICLNAGVGGEQSVELLKRKFGRGAALMPLVASKDPMNMSPHTSQLQYHRGGPPAQTQSAGNGRIQAGGNVRQQVKNSHGIGAFGVTAILIVTGGTVGGVGWLAFDFVKNAPRNEDGGVTVLGLFSLPASVVGEGKKEESKGPEVPDVPADGEPEPIVEVETAVTAPPRPEGAPTPQQLEGAWRCNRTITIAFTESARAAMSHASNTNYKDTPFAKWSDAPYVFTTASTIEVGGMQANVELNDAGDAIRVIGGNYVFNCKKETF